MKITIDVSPEEFKQLVGADKLEQMWLDGWQMAVKEYVDKMWGQELFGLGFRKDD